MKEAFLRMLKKHGCKVNDLFVCYEAQNQVFFHLPDAKDPIAEAHAIAVMAYEGEWNIYVYPGGQVVHASIFGTLGRAMSYFEQHNEPCPFVRTKSIEGSVEYGGMWVAVKSGDGVQLTVECSRTPWGSGVRLEMTREEALALREALEAFTE